MRINRSDSINSFAPRIVVSILTSAVIIIGFSVLLLTSCTSQKELNYLNNLDTTTTSQYFEMQRPDYRIQFKDILYVNIFTLNADMNALLNPATVAGNNNSFREESNIYVFGYNVSDSGTISLPVLGDIRVQGLTLDETQKEIKKRADLYLNNAAVNVKLLSFKFTVIGEVNRPGTYSNFNNQLTVLEAIGMAGDISDFGNRNEVLIVRPTKDGTVTYRINLQDNKLLQSEGYFLLPNDVVIVKPLKNKPFQLNLPTTSLIITSGLSTITTLILLLNFLNSN